MSYPDKRTLSGAHRTFVRKDVEKTRGNVRQLGGEDDGEKGWGGR